MVALPGVKRIIICVFLATASLGAREHLCVRDLVIPDYAPLAWMAQLQGKVVLDVQILANGHVADVRTSGGHRLLQAEAKKNIFKWTFGNFPAASRFPIHHRIVYVYRLEGKPRSENRPTFVFHLPDYVEITTNPPTQFDSPASRQ